MSSLPPPSLDHLRPMLVAARVGRLREAMGDLDALVVTSATNIRYLTGFTGSAGVLFVLPAELVLLTDGRYATQAPEQLAAAGVEATVEIAPAVDHPGRARTITGGLAGRLGLEAAHVSWSRQIEMADRWFTGVGLVATTGVVEGLRRAKDAGELDRLAAAAAIADAALAQVRPMLDERPRERDVASALDAAMRAGGAAGPSFETIVASGPNGAKPHHRAGTRHIEPGEPVVVDFGAVVDGYCSDMTRTLWSGDLRDADLRRAVQVVHAAQAAGVTAVAAGVAAADVDAACRTRIGDAGWADRFVHGTGHGVGLDIHEAPSVAATSTDTLAAGQVVTVEPGVYLPGVGGVRIEDTVVVTAAGCATITLSQKDLP
ncbi:MAG TPA: aminopeptidase P family protein [Acidimicrobiales bacterium]|nr:aminopeptidase P family protein [Acidimicrobiales bacterium]